MPFSQALTARWVLLSSALPKPIDQISSGFKYLSLDLLFSGSAFKPSDFCTRSQPKHARCSRGTEDDDSRGGAAAPLPAGRLLAEGRAQPPPAWLGQDSITDSLHKLTAFSAVRSWIKNVPIFSGETYVAVFQKFCLPHNWCLQEESKYLREPCCEMTLAI